MMDPTAFRRCLSVVLMATCLSGSVGASDWPTYRGDYARTGVSSDPLPGKLAEAWVWKSPNPPQPAWQGEAKWDGYNKVFDMKPRQIFDRAFHAVIADGRVYFGSSADDKVYCLDAQSGRELWSFYTEGPVRLAPTIAEGRVYVGSDDGRVYCLESKTGAVVWQVRATPKDRRIPGNGRLISNWPVRTSLVVQDGLVFTSAGMFPSEGVHLIALDAKTGTERWRQIQTDLPAQGYLLASKSRLYVPAGRNNPAVCDIANGKRLRVVEGAGGTYALLTGDMLVFGPGKTGQLSAVEEGQTDQLASFQGHHMIVTGTRSYLHSDTDLSALDRARYLELARHRKTLSVQQSAIVKQLKKLGEKPDKEEARSKLKAELTALGTKIDAATQAMETCLVWKVPCRWPDALVLAGETVVAGGDGDVVGFQAHDGSIAWKLPVSGHAYGIAASGGSLYVSTDSGAIHCLRASATRADASKNP